MWEGTLCLSSPRDVYFNGAAPRVLAERLEQGLDCRRIRTQLGEGSFKAVQMPLTAWGTSAVNVEGLRTLGLLPVYAAHGPWY